jgi:hypothetical protein
MRDASQYGKQHQGWVELESTVGQGTTFRVHFCVSDAPVDIALEPAILLADRHGPAPAGEDEVNSAYRSGLSPLQGGGSNQVNLTISYLAGPATNWYGVLGTFYYPTNGGTNTLTDLINAGSRNVGVAGLGVSSSTGSFDSAGSGAISPAHPRTNPQRGSRRPLTRAVTPAPSGENGFSPTGCSRKVMFRSGFASSTSNP